MRDDGFDARCCQQIEDTRLRILRGIRQKRLNGFKEMGLQSLSPVQIVGLPRRQVPPRWIAQRIARRMDCCRQSAC